MDRVSERVHPHPWTEWEPRPEYADSLYVRIKPIEQECTAYMRRCHGCGIRQWRWGYRGVAGVVFGEMVIEG